MVIGALIEESTNIEKSLKYSDIDSKSIERSSKEIGSRYNQKLYQKKIPREFCSFYTKMVEHDGTKEGTYNPN
jgi:hypothetical protein